MVVNKGITIAEIVAKRLGADQVLSKYSIDFYNGGGLSLEAACNFQGVDINALISEIEEVNASFTSEQEVTKELLVKEIHEIAPLAQKVASTDGFGHPELIGISDSIEQLISDYVTEEINNEKVDELIDRIRNYSDNYEAPEDASILFKHLYQKIEKLDSDWVQFKNQ